MPDLAEPPKFRSAEVGPGPQSLADWVSFYRWLVSLWKKAAGSIDAPESITLGPPTVPGLPPDEVLLASLASSRALPVQAGPSFDELVSTLLAASHAPAMPIQAHSQEEDPLPAPSPRPAEDQGLAIMALTKPPYPARLPAAAAGNAVLSAACNSDLTLTGSLQDVSNATLSLNQNGTWIVWGTFLFSDFLAITAGVMEGHLSFDGSDQSAIAYNGGADAYSGRLDTNGQVWVVSVSSQPKVAKLRAKTLGSDGTAKVMATHSTIVALFVG